MQIGEVNGLKFAIDTIQAMGGDVIEHDAEKNILIARYGDQRASIDLSNEVFGKDKETARYYVEAKLRFPGIPDTKWTQYINHAVLVQKQWGGLKSGPIMDVRVEMISASGQYVRFLSLSENRYLWAAVEDYAMLEDLGVRVTQHPVKPVVPPRR